MAAIEIAAEPLKRHWDGQVHVTSSQPFGEALLDAMGLCRAGHTFQATQQSLFLAYIGMLDREVCQGRLLLQSVSE